MADAIRGYLLPPADWAAYGRVFDANWLDPVCYRPQGHGLLVAWWIVLTGSLRASVIAELHWTLLLWASVWALVRQLGGKPKTAAFAVLATLAIPVLWAMNNSGLSDLAVAATTVAGIALIVGRTVTLQHVILLLIVVVIGAGAKYSMLPVGFVLICFGFVRLGLHARRQKNLTQRREGALVREEPAVARKERRKTSCFLCAFAPLREAMMVFQRTHAVLCVVLATALLVTGYWYVNNYLIWGNPVFPWGVKHIIHGHELLIRDDVSGFWSLRLQWLWELVTENLWDKHGFVDGNTVNGTGFGPLATALGIPALLGLMFTHRRARLFVILVLLLFVVTWLSVPPQRWAGRYFCFLAVCLVAAVAYVTPWFRAGVPRGVWAVLITTVAIWGAMVGFSHLASLKTKFYWRKNGLTVIPLEMYQEQYGDIVTASLALQQQPNAGKTVVLSNELQVHFVLFHGESPSRQFIYCYPVTDKPLPGPRELNPRAAAPITAQLLSQWKDQNVRYILLICTTSREEVIEKLNQLGVEKIAPDLYEITYP